MVAYRTLANEREVHQALLASVALFAMCIHVADIARSELSYHAWHVFLEVLLEGCQVRDNDWTLVLAESSIKLFVRSNLH